MICPTCGRLPSERIGHRLSLKTPTCPDPIHDLADAAPEMFKALEKLLRHSVPAEDLLGRNWFGVPKLDLDAARAATGQEVTP